MALGQDNIFLLLQEVYNAITLSHWPTDPTEARPLQREGRPQRDGPFIVAR